MIAEYGHREVLLDSTKSPLVFLDSMHSNGDTGRSFVFSRCKDILMLYYYDNVDKFFSRIDDCLSRGLWLAGFFSYEFGYCLEKKLIKCMPETGNLPLAWLGAFKEPGVILCGHKLHVKSHCKNSLFRIKRLKPQITEEEYCTAIKKIKHYIEKGQTYQVNFTFPLTFDFNGDTAVLYKTLRDSQPTAYSAFINTGKDFVLSFSPELFFSLRRGKIVARPMKGTISRGRFLGEDSRRALSLKRSIKNRAENVMITDLLRNDLGKIAETGSVKVRKLFSLEKYSTLWQMTSTVEADVKRNISIKDIFKSLFPCGSVTGAPKIRTMQIIRRLERHPRGVYCGAIGYISPHKEMCFNVAIRTIHIDRKGRGALGIGGGIVYDSIDSQEYDEAILKAGFFIKKYRSFSLIETIRWDNKGYYLLKLHLKRLYKSCKYFDILFNEPAIINKLNHLEAFFNKERIYKVRLLINRRGAIKCFYSILNNIIEPVHIILSRDTVSSGNLYLYHKTTNRHFYDRKRTQALRKGAQEVIFMNERGQITEGSITNIFILKDKKLLTPPVSCGLLPGVLREYMITSAKTHERVLYPDDLLGAKTIYIGNSVRGLIEARLGHG